MMRREGRPTALPGGLMKVCAGVVECANGARYHRAMQQAEQTVVQACDDMTEPQRHRLVRAIRYNIINRKRYPVERLCYVHDLPIGKKRFYKERRRYCMALLRELELLPGAETTLH